jgi:hypothetical protein
MSDVERNTRNGLGYVIDSMLIFAIIGMCVKILFGNNTSVDGSYGRANSAIWGYGMVAFAILTAMFVSLAIQDKIRAINSPGETVGVIKFLKAFLTSSGSSILTIVTLFIIITLNLSFYKRINKGSVAKEYYQLSAGTSFLFVFQIVCLFQYLRTSIKIQTNTANSDEAKDIVKNQNRLSFASYFICFINIVVVGMMTIILEFFSTDG